MLSLEPELENSKSARGCFEWFIALFFAAASVAVLYLYFLDLGQAVNDALEFAGMAYPVLIVILVMAVTILIIYRVLYRETKKPDYLKTLRGIKNEHREG